MKTGDTIAAQATPPGRGGVGIIRVSGPDVLFITEAVLDKKIKEREAFFCSFLSANKEIIDQGIAIYFSSPLSFTGEDVLELHGHGGQTVMDLLLQRVLELGARIAVPGEFIQRGFLNRKLDLLQVEAVADLISASTSHAAQNAARSLSGVFSEKINDLIELLMELRTKVEAMIDFIEEEDVGAAADNSLQQSLESLLLQIKKIKDKAQQGIIIQEGITVVITGKTNAGKSSLLNFLSGEDRAIVTSVPGTTRDVLRANIQIDGLAVNLLDTAGLHDKPDPVEKEGIRRAREEIKRADHVLVMVDASLSGERSPKEAIKEFLEFIPEGGRLTVLYNKIDLTKERSGIKKIDGIDCVYFSAKTGEGMNLLKEHLKSSAGIHTVEQGFSARRRHLFVLEKAENHLKNALGERELEIVAEELKEVQNVLGEITGQVTSEDLLSRIFSEFCIGK